MWCCSSVSGHKLHNFAVTLNAQDLVCTTVHTTREQKDGRILRGDHQLIADRACVALYFLGQTPLNLLPGTLMT